MKQNQDPPTNDFSVESVQWFRDSRYDHIDDQGRFKRDSLTSTPHPYQRLPSRQDVPDSIRARAELAHRCMITEGGGRYDAEGNKRRERIVICQSTPQWVADLLNRVGEGIIDWWRQRFVYESLKMIKAGAPPSIGRASGMKDLKDWRESPRDRERYVRRAKQIIPDASKKTTLALAQRLERFEVYFQVYEQLQQPPYDGRLHDMNYLSKMHQRQPETSELEDDRT